MKEKSRDRIFYIFILLFWCSLFLFPRTLASEDHGFFLSKLRFEDLLLPIWLVYIYLKRDLLLKVLGENITLAICFWGIFVVIFTFINCLTRPYPLWAGLAFAGKELQYVLYFCFFAVFASRNERFSVFGLAVPAFLLLLYAIIQIYLGRFTGYYGGLQFPFESGVSASSEIGALSAVLFICAFCLMLNRNQIITMTDTWTSSFIYPLLFISFLMLMLTLSRTNIIAAAAAVIILALVKTVHLKFDLRFLALTGTFIVVVILVLTQLSAFKTIVYRFGKLADTGFQGRIEEAWKPVIIYQADSLSIRKDPWPLLVGFGLGSPNYLVRGLSHGLTLNVDNQYLRRFFEVGLAGSLIWGWLLLGIGARILNQTRETSYHALFRDLVLGIFITIFVSGMGLEILQVIRTGSIFYSLVGILLGLSFAISASQINTKTTRPLTVKKRRLA